MKSLITGVSGFVGPYLVEHLVANRHTVYGLERVDKKVKNCTIYVADVLDAEKVADIVKKVKPDYIFHLAGQSSVEVSWKEPELTMRINADGTRNLLDGVVAAKINPKIVVVSSSEIYGNPQKLPLTEDHLLKPTSPYGESRLKQEEVVQDYVKKQNLQIVIARSFPHTGPGQIPKFVCPAFAEQIVRIEKKKAVPEIKTGNLGNERDFCDVRDVVRAYLLLAEKGRNGEAYNICYGKAWKIRAVLDYLLSMSPAKPTVTIDPDKLRKNDMKKVEGSHAKITKETGWKPEIRFEDTLKDILEYWRKTI